MLHRTLGLLLGLGTATSLASPAEACSPPLPGFGQARPLSGASLPANAQIVFDGYDFAPFEAQWLDFDFFVPLRVDQLGPLGRVFLESDVIGPGPNPLPDRLELWINHTAQAPIEPLQLTYQVDFDSWDAEPPVATGLATGRWEYRESEPGLCEPGGYVVTLEVPPVRDDWGVAAYQLIEYASRTAPERIVRTRLAPADPTDTVILVHHSGEVAARHCYGVVAYDVAGNVLRTADDLCLDVGQPPGPDAGVLDSGLPQDAGPSADASALSDAGSVADTGDSRRNPLASSSRGCACSAEEPARASRTFGLLGAMLALLGLRAIRRS